MDKMKILRSCSPLMTVLVPGTTLTMSALRAEGGIKFRGNCSGNGSTIEKKMWSELLKQD